MELNASNLCKHLVVGDVEVEKPLYFMYNRQLLLQQRLNQLAKPTLVERAAAVVYWRHCLASEADEMLEWTITHARVDLVETRMEAIDMLHFLFNIGIALDFKPEEVFLNDSVTEYTPWLDFGMVANGWLHLSQSVTKFIDLLPWKTWKNYPDTVQDNSVLLPKYADILTNMYIICFHLGMHEQDIVNHFVAKNDENHARQDRGY